MYPKHMMATTAWHKLGNISRDEPDLCYVEFETEEHYHGHWVTGFGFIDVEFPKVSTRDLTKEEVEHYNGTHVQLADYPPVKLKVD